MGAGMSVSVQKGVGFYLVRMQMVMIVGGEFGGGDPAVGVIVSMRARCVLVYFVTAVRRYGYYGGVGETHLQRPPDSYMVPAAREFSLGPEVRETAIAFSQARA